MDKLSGGVGGGGVAQFKMFRLFFEKGSNLKQVTCLYIKYEYVAENIRLHHHSFIIRPSTAEVSTSLTILNNNVHYTCCTSQCSARVQLCRFSILENVRLERFSSG